MSRDLEDRIAATAAQQHGVLTYAQLLEAGLSSSAVGRRVKAGRLRRLHRGVYQVGPLSPPLAREMAAVLASGPGACLSHLSAAVLWDLRPRPGDKAIIHTTVEGAGRVRRPGVRVHRTARLNPGERTTRDGIPFTTPLRTVLDLATLVGSREIELAVARAEREGLVTLEELRAVVRRHPSRRGIKLLREVLEVRGGPVLTRSEAERLFLALIRAAGLPPPEANVPFGRYEIDFLWRDAGIAVEVDGRKHHSLQPRFEGDRRKDTWLLARGITVIRLSWRQITDEAMATGVQIGLALARAGVIPA